MKAGWLFVLAASVAAVAVTFSTSAAQPPAADCRWLSGKDRGNGLECRLRTLHGGLTTANLSNLVGGIFPERLSSLRLECNDQVFFHSFIGEHSFEELRQLRSLEIEYCKLGRLPAHTFDALTSLKNLTLRTHNIDWPAINLEFETGTFQDLLQLEQMDLSTNNIWTLPDAVFCSMQNLRYLNLTRNRIPDLEMLGFTKHRNWRKSISSCGENIRILDLTENSLEIVPSETFSSLNRLEQLYLTNNVISELPDKALSGLGSLKIINLSSNKLVTLPPELFATARSIKEIHLQNNSITILAPGLFEGLEQLLALDLSNNELTSEWVNSDTFKGLLRLVVLNLSRNKITRLDSGLFRGLYSLQILRLDYNSITSVNDNTFTAMYNLHTLIMSHNQLTAIDANTLSDLYVLSLLNLDKNVIASIHPEALKNCTNLQDVNLSGNNLFEVPPALLDLQLLKTLDLGENHISYIENVSFSHMQHLYGLRLIDNRIGNVDKNTLIDLPSLEVLNLAKNQIHKVDPGSFASNTKLKAVRLDANYLKDISGLFVDLPNLIWLNLSANELETFDYSMIPTRLQWLDLHSNHIRELGNSLELESQIQLRTFDISFNYLLEVSSSVIPDSVELLFLNDNHISVVQPYTFFKKPNLTRVDLFGNQIKRLDQNALRISPGVKDALLPEFYVGGNPFQCDCSMEWLQRINNPDSLPQHPRVMDLESIYCKLLYNRDNSYLPLVEAQPSQFLCEYVGHCFALCHCCDFDACDCEMTCPTNCTCYHDQSWASNIVDCSDVGHINLPERIPMDATELYLDGNDIQSLSSHIFIGRKNLHILFLNNSNLEVVHNRTFNGLKALELLHLQDNQLKSLKGNEFEGLSSLNTLDLRNNHISTINNSTFLPLISLQILKLDGNRLMNFPVWHMSSSVTSLTLSNNPWTCDCEFLHEFREWLNLHRDTVPDVQDINCVKNETTEGTLVLEANVTECINNATEAKTIIRQMVMQDYVPLLVATLAVFVVVIVTSLLVFCYRNTMRVWLHSRFGFRLGRTHEYEGDSEKLFDAFVSYSSKDETFVTQVLASRLEQGNCPYRLCLHYRDFPVGAYLTDTIIQAVEASRRTIMVLSENFIKSEWCRFEFKSAHHQVLKDRRKRLIMILVGEVPQKDLDPDIRLYLKTNTYLQWGDKRFWEKLRFAMPDKKHTRTSVRSIHNNANASPRAVAIHI